MDYGIVVDVETTGIDPQLDSIIEVGVLEFAWQEGADPEITTMYSGLEDPQMPLSPEIVHLTGLNDALLAGRVIDWGLVRRYFERASLVIAHNAAFDRAFLQRRPELAGLQPHWACSLEHIDWRAKGMRSRSLNHLAADHGFLNPFAHRALFDVATTFRLVVPFLEEMIARSYERQFLISAFGAPFAQKDKLREKGYRWDSEARVWRRRIFESTLTEEREFLSLEIYQGQAMHAEEEIRHEGQLENH